MNLKKQKEEIMDLEVQELEKIYESEAKKLNEDLKVLVAKGFTLEDGTEEGKSVYVFYNEDGLHIPLQTPDGAIWYMLVDTDTIDKMIFDFIDRQNSKNG